MKANTSGMTTEAPAAPWLRICVTGGIACGKSLVGAYLEALGVAVIEADTVCHGLMRAGTPLFSQIVAAFGRAILAPDGEIDRAVLGRRVFGDAAALASLNALLHPAAQSAIEAWVLARREEARLQPAAAISNQQSAISNSVQGWRGGVAAIIPLLYETAGEAAWDRVICVSAPIVLQRKRLRSKGFTEKEAHDRMAAQWPVEEKMKRADYVVFNAGTQVCAQRQTVQVMQHIGIHVEKSDGK
ncbi:MAG: dephospho-CoA kinase [Kiritimatiellae bacterium]|nr:dephospho-CoA kinase [Verrucomicrobiota bacterium]MBU4285807.1 dephospho-CoA kinase [Verrucomicrobiota bacterium]MBU4366310.1 dephospho-CoA kinase [Verrucomicrobiota bacterium]MCG2661116.1 dephospho-CoA kinase [Kiritimatiellia bacterium]